LAAATDFTWADAVIAREALRTRAAKTGLLIVVLTLSNDLLAGGSAGAFNRNAAERGAPLLINYERLSFRRRILQSWLKFLEGVVDEQTQNREPTEPSTVAPDAVVNAFRIR
jgi:hypothetical protein